MPSLRSSTRQYLVALRALLVFTLVVGIVYPLAILAAGLAAPAQAGGSLVSVDGEVVGSRLIGQSFSDADGAPLREWFQPRPSAAGDGYDATSSGGSNQGPESETLIDDIAARKDAIERLDGAAAEDIPPDAVTASGSGLDPHISPEYAALQVPRVAAARSLEEADVSSLVDRFTQQRDLGYLGEPRVNVLELNIALDDFARNG